MKQLRTAYELLKPGEKAIVIYTRGKRLKDYGNGTCSTSWWKIAKSRKFDKIIVYKRKGEEHTDNVVFTGKPHGKPLLSNGYSKLRMVDFKVAGSTTSDWPDFADTFSKEIRYLPDSLKDAVKRIEKELESEGAFDPSSEQDAKKMVLRSIALRQGQPKFRANLLRVYVGKCAVTGTSIAAILEAAHIIPYNGPHTNHVTNGLLLRSDIHALFDLWLLSIDPITFKIYCSKQIQSEPMYEKLNGQPLRVPEKAIEKPNLDALRSHFANRIP